MIDRCFNPDNAWYHRYGGRGITVCARWLGPQGFNNFLADMGERPAGKSIDRFPDNDGNYDPGNCRWATAQEQTINRKTTKLTRDSVQEIHGRHEHGETQASIAAALPFDRLRGGGSEAAFVIEGHRFLRVAGLPNESFSGAFGVPSCSGARSSP